MNIVYRIYYDNDGIIKTVTTEPLIGQHIEVPQKTFKTVGENPSKYIVLNGKVGEIKKIKYPAPRMKISKTFKLGKDGKCYIVHKNNLFYCVDNVTIKPSWFDSDKHSWAVYDS